MKFSRDSRQATQHRAVIGQSVCDQLYDRALELKHAVHRKEALSSFHVARAEDQSPPGRLPRRARTRRSRAHPFRASCGASGVRDLRDRRPRSGRFNLRNLAQSVLGINARRQPSAGRLAGYQPALLRHGV